MPLINHHLSKYLFRLTTYILTLSLLLSPLFDKRCHAFSVTEEKEVGKKLLTLVRKRFRVLDEPDITQYINKLGENILEVSGNQFFDYHFFVIANNDFNAFAAPSGLIFIHSGLLEAMNSQGELLSVLAHECGHVRSRHISDRIKKSKKISIGSAAMMIAGLALGGGALSQALVTGSMAAGTSLNLKFSREDEEEADRLAFKWMRDLKSDPQAMESMLYKMHKVSVYQMTNIPPYLLTHPEPKRRMGYVQDLIALSPGIDYVTSDDFSFLRIKYRAMSLTKDNSQLRPVFLRTARKGNTLQKTMAHYGLYQVYMRDAEYDKAEASLRKVMDLFPEKSILLADLGVLYLKSGRFQEALEILKKARSADLNNAFATFHLAKTYQQFGMDQKAMDLYEKLLATINEYSKLHYNIGELKTKHKETGAGHYHLGRYFFLEGDHKTAQYHLNTALSDKTSTQKIKDSAKQLLDTIKEAKKS